MNVLFCEGNLSFSIDIIRIEWDQNMDSGSTCIRMKSNSVSTNSVDFCNNIQTKHIVIFFPWLYILYITTVDVGHPP